MPQKRDQFVGFHLSKAQKLALYEEAKSQGVSVSKLLAKMTVEQLQELGRDTFTIPSDDPKLPFDKCDGNHSQLTPCTDPECWLADLNLEK